MRLEAPAPCRVARRGARSMVEWNEGARQHQDRMLKLRHRGAAGEAQKAISRRPRGADGRRLSADLGSCFSHAVLDPACPLCLPYLAERRTFNSPGAHVTASFQTGKLLRRSHRQQRHQARNEQR